MIGTMETRASDQYKRPRIVNYTNLLWLDLGRSANAPEHTISSKGRAIREARGEREEVS